jgi:hypothetical protein
MIQVRRRPAGESSGPAMDAARENAVEQAETLDGSDDALDQASAFALWNIVQHLAERTRLRAVDALIRTLDRSPSIYTTKDSSLGSFWLDFCAQVQGEPSGEWNEFVARVQRVIEGELVLMQAHEREALWLLTPAGEDWRDEPDVEAKAIPVSIGDLVEYLYGHVWQEAAEDEDPRISGLQAGDDTESGEYAVSEAFDADDIAGIETRDRVID